MTPHELNLYIQDFNEKQIEKSEEKLILTYLGAAWQRAKKMPNLKQILGKELPKKKMTPKEMLAQVRKLNAQLGGETIGSN